MKIFSFRRNRYITSVSILLIMVALMFGTVGANCIQPSGGGGGGGTIQIQTWTDLYAIRNNLGGSYILMNDLNENTAGYATLASNTANGGKGWQPIGTSDHPFTGTFDGQYYTIFDLVINRPAEDNVGLFGCSSGTIKNIVMINAKVTGHMGVATLVAANNGAVSRCCSVSVHMPIPEVTGYESVGGLVGYNNGSVDYSYSSYSLVGTFKFCGGLVGYSDTAGQVRNCYSWSIVTGNWIVGGLLGYNGGIVSNSHSESMVTTGTTDAGGLVGTGPGTVTNSFWDKDTSGQATSAGGTGKTFMEMMVIATFSGAGWDIGWVPNRDTRDASKIWNIVDAYPFLSWLPVGM
jgi:hypothetical protein